MEYTTFKLFFFKLMIHIRLYVRNSVAVIKGKEKMFRRLTIGDMLLVASVSVTVLCLARKLKQTFRQMAVAVGILVEIILSLF